MHGLSSLSVKTFVTGTLLCLLPRHLHALEPNAKDLDDAIQIGDFTKTRPTTTP